MWLTDYTDVAEHAILRLDKPVRERILNFMGTRVASAADPRVLAEPLYGELRVLWRFRVGDYRIICDIQLTVKIVEVQTVAHRSHAYRRMGR